MVGFVQNTNPNKTHSMAEQEITCFYAEEYGKNNTENKGAEAGPKALA